MTKVSCLAPCLTVGLMLLGLTLGCSESNMGRVTGTVRMDGKPLVNALVMFKPLSGERPAAGRTNELGRYELYFTRQSKGAVLGEHTVEISTFDEIMGDDTTETVPETVPARYNVQTELTANVQRGINEFDFDLESGGEIIQPID